MEADFSLSFCWEALEDSDLEMDGVDREVKAAAAAPARRRATSSFEAMLLTGSSLIWIPW